MTRWPMAIPAVQLEQQVGRRQLRDGLRAAAQRADGRQHADLRWVDNKIAVGCVFRLS
jgi:hypothetical protein